MKKIDFNQNWEVRKDGTEEWKPADLPHDAMIYEARSKESSAAGAGGYFYGGRYVYKKQWEVPAEWSGQSVIMECEGVYMNAVVYVNGTEAQRWIYGYTNFYIELDAYLKYGEQNEIMIIADNSKNPNTRWYSGSGIYREVHLYTGAKEHIAPEGIRVHALNASEVKVDIVCSMEEGTKVLAEVLDGEKVVAAGKGISQTLMLRNAKLWDAENPYLYRFKVCLEKDGNILDEAEVSFGMRVISTGKNGFKINGREVLLRGACVHHDNGILGACAFRDAEWRKIRILKEAGFNAVRSSHNPMSKAMLAACDTLGMYVIDESFDMWRIQKNPFDYGGAAFEEWWRKDTEAMILKDYNHPSVIMYSIGNEISDLGAPEGQKLCKEMSEYVKSIDNSRPVTLGINLMLASMVAKGKGLYGKGKDGEDKGTGSQSMDSMPTSSFFNMMMNRMGSIIDKMSSTKGADAVVEKVSCFLDVPGYNYATSRYKKEHKLYGERAFVGSETLPKMLYTNWQMVKSIPSLAGDFMWTGWDYLGESGIGTVRYTDKKTKKDVEDGLIVSGGAGVIDICGKKRPEVGWNKSIWGLSGKPVIGVDPVSHADDFKAVSMWRNTDAVESWSWEGFEGKKTNVTVYSNGDKVELLLNGKSLGKKKVKECKAGFTKISYVPGELTAKVYDSSGRFVSEESLISAEGKTEITLRPEKTVLRANGQDLCFLDIELTGANGVVKASSDKKLTVKVEGAGVLQAFGSARPHMSENFYSNTHTTYYGKALAVIRAGCEPGKIKITVSGEGLREQIIMLDIK